MLPEKKKKQKENSNNLILETLGFLNQRIDIIVGKSEIICDLLDEFDDPILLEKLNCKLSELEKELDHIGSKIDLEKFNYKKWKKSM